ncbi:MAG TPA: GAF domain-containing SpoIIE family protein phosphatase [Ignavibacteriaceae bacterium]|nr:GAF domain-containing SpoIIE family protein phosphatase [Ignavibacteriaceae bacterium]
MDTDQITSQITRLQDENHKLRIAVEELSVLNEIATAITSTQTIEKIVDLIVRKCVKHIKVEQGVVMLLDEKDTQNPFHTMIRKQDSTTNLLPFRLDTQLTGWMLMNKAPLLINDFQSDKRFSTVKDVDFPIKSLLSVPMLLKGKMIGLVTVFNKKSASGFTINDQRLLGIIAAQSAHVVENARLYQNEQALIKLQEEMRLAYDIQVDLLPKEQPKVEGYQIAGRSIPAKDVGGDYFDFIQMDENRLSFCLADITGKGMPAALLMANLQATLRGQILVGKTCKDCVAFSNDLLYYNTAPNKFATLFSGILDNKNHEITYCNAGHNNPILISEDDKIIRPDVGGLIVGIAPSIPYEEATIKLKTNDILVVFSDGITEAMNKEEEEFDEPRLIELIKSNKDKSSEELIELIFIEVNNFSKGQPQSDDMTIVIIKRA